MFSNESCIEKEENVLKLKLVHPQTPTPCGQYSVGLYVRHWKEKGSLSGVSVHVAVRTGGLGAAAPGLAPETLINRAENFVSVGRKIGQLNSASLKISRIVHRLL